MDKDRKTGGQVKPIVCVCSRRKSSRIPDKAFYKIAGVPTIKHIENRLAGFDVAFLVPPNEVEDYRAVLDGVVVGGNEQSPLHRIADFIRDTDYTHVVRVTGDDILVDKQTINTMLKTAAHGNYGYVFAPRIARGMDAEVICRENILHAAESAEPSEFVSYHVKGAGCPNERVFALTPRAEVNRDYRLTMDWPEDALLLETVLRELGPDANNDSICHFLDARPEILKLNALPKYSIYTCAHNAALWIGQTISSILSCGMDFEYIIVDDASTDGTLTEIAKAAAGDKRVKIVLNAENMGLASSSNKAIGVARGKYVMRVDADDIVLPGHFEAQIERMANMGADLVYPAYYEMTENGAMTYTIVGGAVNHHAGCCLMSHSWVNAKKFKDGIRHWDGHELYLRAKNSARIAYHEIPIWAYRVRLGSMSRANHDERAKIKAKIENGVIKYDNDTK